MSQISPPLRILLAGSVLFMAAWLVLLKPGGSKVEPVAPVTGEPASAPGQIAQTAQQTADAASQAAQQHAGEPATSGAAGSATAAGTTAVAPVAAVKGKAALTKAGMPSGVAERIDKKVVVLAFVNRDAADDRRVAGSMRKVYRHRGKVWTKTASIEDVSKYAAITRGADVQQSPTVVVVDRDRTVTTLVGFVDSVSINQAVVDALLRRGHPVDDSPYLQKLEGTCGDLNSRIRDLREPRNLKEFRAYVSSLGAIADRFYPRIRKAKAPKRYRDVHRKIMALINADERLYRQLDRFVRTGQLSPGAIQSEVRSMREKSRKLDLRLAGLGMEDCR